MFSFVQWDSPLLLVGELALSVAVVAGVMFVVRMVGSRPPRSPGNGDEERSVGKKTDA
jgi:hypothetical protein